MTEDTWLAPEPLVISMVAWLRESGASRRKARLFVAECGSRVLPHRTDDRSRNAIKFLQANAERAAPGLRGRELMYRAAGQASNEALAHSRAAEDADDYARRCVPERAAFVAAMAADSDPFTAAYYCAEHTANMFAWLAVVNSPSESEAARAAGMELARRNERQAQVSFLRDIFGNPFRSVAFDSEWRTSAAVQLARQMYEGRDFGLMPILADALQDAGCDHPDVLAHCRDPQAVHVRGCWVVDLVLGKA